MDPGANSSAHIADRLPFVTEPIPGTGGRLRASDEDFRVDEIPAYEPTGTGDHVFVRLEKRGRTTFEVVRDLARALGVAERDIGTAGLKDRRAVSTQVLSLPPPVDPDRVLALALPGVAILSAVRHGHKLRTGHLRGNRFALRLRDLDVPAAEAAARARAVFDRLAAPPGAPNWFGAQRFGRDGRTATEGRAVILGTRGGPRGSARRLCVSAYQALLFNRILERRIRDRLFDRVLAGDVLKKTTTGGLFTCEDPRVDQQRLDSGEIVPTGPMYGHSMMAPPPGTDAAAREQAVLDEEELTPDSFRSVGKLAAGTRRPLAIQPADVEVTAHDDFLELGFALPSGCYATAVMREVIKGPTDFPE